MDNNNQTILKLDKILEQFEKDLSWKRPGTMDERTAHCLSQYKQIADNALHQARNFLEDVKTQFKALEIITEGLTDEGLNHGQKRTIANHIISMLRKMVDRLDEMEYKYDSHNLDRYNFFRSRTPEGRLFEDRRELKEKVEASDKILKSLQEKHPEIYDALVKSDEIPF